MSELTTPPSQGEGPATAPAPALTGLEDAIAGALNELTSFIPSWCKELAVGIVERVFANPAPQSHGGPTPSDDRIALVNAKCGEMCKVFDGLGFQMHPLDSEDPLGGGLPERVQWAEREIKKLRGEGPTATAPVSDLMKCKCGWGKVRASEHASVYVCPFCLMEKAKAQGLAPSLDGSMGATAATTKGKA